MRHCNEYTAFVTPSSGQPPGEGPTQHLRFSSALDAERCWLSLIVLAVNRAPISSQIRLCSPCAGARGPTTRVAAASSKKMVPAQDRVQFLLATHESSLPDPIELWWRARRRPTSNSIDQRGPGLSYDHRVSRHGDFGGTRLGLDVPTCGGCGIHHQRSRSDPKQ